MLIPQNPSPLAIGLQRLTATTPAGATASTWSGGRAPLPAQTCPRVTLATVLAGQRPINQETKPVHTWNALVISYYGKLHGSIFLIQGDWTDWGMWSKCGVNCSRFEHQGEMTRSRNLRDNPEYPPDIQTSPCYVNCPPGKVYVVQERCFQTPSDCSKLDLNMRQVKRGPLYELSTTLARPSTEEISSVIMVSQVVELH